MESLDCLFVRRSKSFSDHMLNVAELQREDAGLALIECLSPGSVAFVKAGRDRQRA